MTQDTEDVVRNHHLYRNLWDDFQTVEKDLRNCALLVEHHYNSLTPVANKLKERLETDASTIQSLSDRIDVLEANVVELWHESEAGRKALHEYLGMSWEEYIIWATPRAALHQEGIAPK